MPKNDFPAFPLINNLLYSDDGEAEKRTPPEGRRGAGTVINENHPLICRWFYWRRFLRLGRGFCPRWGEDEAEGAVGARFGDHFDDQAELGREVGFERAEGYRLGADDEQADGGNRFVFDAGGDEAHFPDGEPDAEGVFHFS